MQSKKNTDRLRLYQNILKSFTNTISMITGQRVLQHSPIVTLLDKGVKVPPIINGLFDQVNIFYRQVALLTKESSVCYQHLYYRPSQKPQPLSFCFMVFIILIRCYNFPIVHATFTRTIKK